MQSLRPKSLQLDKKHCILQIPAKLNHQTSEQILQNSNVPYEHTKKNQPCPGSCQSQSLQVNYGRDIAINNLKSLGMAAWSVKIEAKAN